MRYLVKSHNDTHFLEIKRDEVASQIANPDNKIGMVVYLYGNWYLCNADGKIFYVRSLPHGVWQIKSEIDPPDGYLLRQAVKQVAESQMRELLS